MARELVIGLDIGTTSVKAIMFELDGKVVAESERMITSFCREPDWKEQNPEEIEHSAAEVINEVIQSTKMQTGELLTMGISCAMHSLICMDPDGNPLSRMLIWSDGRSEKQADRLQKTRGGAIYQRTGTPIHPMSPLVKLLWMKETKYEAYRNAAYFMSMKEYLILKWFGKRMVDFSMASASGLFNLKNLEWDKEALDIADIKESQLSEIVPPTKILTGLKRNFTERTGLLPDMPVVIGAADGQLANLGSGAVLKGEVAVSVGTSGAIRQMTKGFPINPHHQTFTYAFTEETSIIGGATNNGGIALQWLKDLLNFQGNHAEFIAGAEQVPPGSNGIFFLPYINGERAPLWNQKAKGSFFGLGVDTDRAQLVRAVLEGITFNLYHIGKSLEEAAGKAEKVSVNGGLAKSLVWVQIMADVFGKEIHLSNTHHNAAWGAAWTALVGIGKANSLEAIKQNLPAGKVIHPDEKNHKDYIELFEKYEKLSKDLAVYYA